MSLFLNFNAHPTRLQPNEDQVGTKQEHIISQVRDTMAFGPRHFVAPAAAFTMAVTVVFYVKYTISTARAESHIRRSDALRPDRDDEPKRVERSQKSWRGGTCLSSYGNWEADLMQGCILWRDSKGDTIVHSGLTHILYYSIAVQLTHFAIRWTMTLY